jgi:hypothetical protein
VLLAVLAFAPEAMAEPLQDGGVTTQQIARIMRGKGLSPDIASDKDGDPLIRGAIKDLKFGVFFVGCHDSPVCESITFSAGFKVKNMSQTKIAQWNRTRRFGRAYLDENSEAWVEMDVDLAYGATTEAVENNLDRWASVMSEFSRFTHP